MLFAAVAAKGVKNPVLFRLITNGSQMPAERNGLGFRIFPTGLIEQQIRMMVVRIYNQRT